MSATGTEGPAFRAGTRRTPGFAPQEQNFIPGAVRRLETIKGAAPSLGRLFQRALAGKCSPRQAIKAQCLDCQGLDREGVCTCGDHCCPLWHFRPFQSPKRDSHSYQTEKGTTGPRTLEHSISGSVPQQKPAIEVDKQATISAPPPSAPRWQPNQSVTPQVVAPHRTSQTSTPLGECRKRSESKKQHQ